MTSNEFKAWFEGYLEGIDNELPNPEQFRKIIEQVRAIEDNKPYWSMPYPIYYYYPEYYKYVISDSPASTDYSLKAQTNS